MCLCVGADVNDQQFSKKNLKIFHKIEAAHHESIGSGV